MPGAARDGRRKPRILLVIAAIFACPPPCVERCRACRTLGTMAEPVAGPRPDRRLVGRRSRERRRGGQDPPGPAPGDGQAGPGQGARAGHRHRRLRDGRCAPGHRRHWVAVDDHGTRSRPAASWWPDPGTGLNDAVRAGVARVPRAQTEAAGVAVLLGDLPAARAADLRAALQAAAGARASRRPRPPRGRHRAAHRRSATDHRAGVRAGLGHPAYRLGPPPAGARPARVAHRCRRLRGPRRRRGARRGLPHGRGAGPRGRA